ncbi:MAG: DUF2802 domain-containing protein [Syntrophales bacterium]|nr:DUF2802 domain-containing protein [Syntrophales bacterium]
MSTELMLGIQIFADVVLCAIIAFLLWVLNTESRKRRCGVDADSLTELRGLIESSKASADYLVRALDDGKKSLEEVAHSLDERETRLRTLMEGLDRSSGDMQKDPRYGQAMEMARQGVPGTEIANALDLTEGEVDLIVSLDLRKNKDAG